MHLTLTVYDGDQTHDIYLMIKHIILADEIHDAC